MPKPTEIATLIVNGQKFEDWDFVMVRRNWGDPFAYFQFSAAERDPTVIKPSNKIADWTKLQFKPGDRCTVLLAGQLAITGFIEIRQVAYDANSHGVMLIGKSYTANAAKSSVDSKTGNFDNKTIKQVADEVWGQYGVGVKMIGTVDNTPFDKLQNNKGEPCWDFTERIARDRCARLACDAFGSLLLIGDHSNPIVAGLVEGKNIKSCQCIFDSTMVFEGYDVHASSQASDDHNGTDASEQTATRTTGISNILNSKLITPIEESVKSQSEVDLRAEFEKRMHDGTMVQATITVQGWLREGMALWSEGEHVHVYSPMIPMDNEMAIQQVIFQQDDKRGSVSVLTCVPPEWLNARPGYDVSGG
jgi:prophage tail gpP-like protein